MVRQSMHCLGHHSAARYCSCLLADLTGSTHITCPPPYQQQPTATRHDAHAAQQACLAEQRQRRVGPCGAAPADGAAGEGIPPVGVLVVLTRNKHRVSAGVFARHIPAGVAATSASSQAGPAGATRHRRPPSHVVQPRRHALAMRRRRSHSSSQSRTNAIMRSWLTRGRQTVECPCAGPLCGTRSRGGSPPPHPSPPPQSGRATPLGAPCRCRAKNRA